MTKRKREPEPVAVKPAVITIPTANAPRASIVIIPIDSLDEPVNPLRAEMDDQKLADLETDIRANGLYYPLIVKQHGERFEVVDGHRRLLACRAAHVLDVPCIVQSDDSPPAEAVKLKTNLLREDNTDAELAVWLGELAETHGYTLEKLAQMVGRSESWVNARTDLLRGCPKVLQALGDRQINFSQAQVLNRCKDDRWRDLGLHYAISDHVPASRLNEWLIRNAGVVIAAPQLMPTAEGAQPEATDQGPGIVCEFCGGHKDPQNMVNLWLHRWEWTIVQQILSMRQQELEAANQPQGA